MKFLLSAMALLLIIESCNITNNALVNGNEAQEIFSGSYKINTIGNTKSVTQQLSITFDDTSKRVTGFSGCNTFFGNYSMNGNSITFKNIATSKKLCQQEINKMESQFLDVLNKTTSFKIKDETLSLLENDKQILQAIKIETTKNSNIIKDTSDIHSITYKALSRGLFIYVSISKSGVIISSDVNLEEVSRYESKKQDWEELSEMIEAKDKATLQKLKAPTNKRQYDGAAAATLVIKKGGIEIITPYFDHGYPPKEIEALVNKVLSIKESVSKQ